MNSYKLSIAFLSLLSALMMSCGSSDSQAPVRKNSLGGVSVGNGMTSFKSNAGFSVEYNSALDLKQISDREFSISNQTLAGSPKENLSSINFHILQAMDDKNKVVKDMSDLKNYLEKKETDAANYKAGTISKALGFENEISNKDEVIGNYYVLGSNLTVLHIRLLARTAAQGRQLITPILNRIIFDLKSPEVLAFKTLTPKVKAGEKIKIAVQAKDDSGEISPRVMLDFYETKSEKVLKGFSSFKQLGNDWLEMEIPVNSYVEPGKYVLSNLTIMDRSGNQSRIALRKDNPDYYELQQDELVPTEDFAKFKAESTYKHLAQSPLEVELINDGIIDRAFPSIQSVEFAKTDLKAGDMTEVTVKVSDDTGLYDLDFCHVMFTAVDRAQDEDGLSVSFDPPKLVGKDTLVFTMKIPPRMADGDYFVNSVEVMDKSGKQTTIEVAAYNSERKDTLNFFSNVYHANIIRSQLFMTVSDSAPFGEKINIKSPHFRVNTPGANNHDRTPPQLLAAKMLTNTVHPGGTLSFAVKVKDTETNLLFDQFHFSIVRKEGYFVAVDDNPEFLKSQKVTSLGEDWFKVDYILNPDFPTGEYFVNFMIFADEALNFGFYGVFDIVDRKYLDGNMVEITPSQRPNYLSFNSAETDAKQSDVPALRFSISPNEKIMGQNK